LPSPASFDKTCWDLAKEAGLGKTPEQMLMASYGLGIGRTIARMWMPRVPNEIAPVDKNPGCELAESGFKPYFLNAMKQYKQFLDSLGQPYMVWTVDEPREVPNPWNRNLKDTNTYGDYIGEAGITTRFVTPMGDVGGGLDYTTLVDHADVITPHADAGSVKIIEKTKALNKKLAFYNSTMSRYIWGYYIWSMGAMSYSQWHWSFPDGTAVGGYPGNEWYNPFTSMSGYASNAPIAKYPGGFLYQSVYFSAADGITDYAYLYTLEKAVAKQKAAGAKTDAVTKAETLLNQIKSECPPFPHNEGAREPIEKLDGWRTQIAACLTELGK
jgi:hypothetical protein